MALIVPVFVLIFRLVIIEQLFVLLVVYPGQIREQPKNLQEGLLPVRDQAIDEGMKEQSHG